MTERVSSEQAKRKWTDMTIVIAEGARIGIVTCLRCGAAILVDLRDDEPSTMLHDRWHAASAAGEER